MDKHRNLRINSAVQKLINDLQHEDEKVRRYAAEDLGYDKVTEAIPHLVKGLEDGAISVSEACADALVKIGGEQVAEQIAPALATENVRLRNHASEIMNLLGEPAVPVLAKLMESEDHDVRMFAIDNLVYISSKTSVNILIKALDDVNLNVAAAAANGLGKVGDDEHLEILERYLDSENWMKCAVLSGMGSLGNKKAIESILPLIQEDDLMIKMSAIQALSKLADNTILPELVNLLKEESLELFGTETLNVIYEIIASYPEVDYSYLFDDKLIEAMMRLTTMGDIGCRLKAIEILGFSDNEEIVPALIDLIKADGIDTRKSIVNSIVKIDPQDLSSLKQYLEDNNATFEQKCTALDCIGRSSGKERFEIIKTFLSSKDETLPRITLDAIHNDFKPAPIKEISSLLTSNIPEIRVSAADAMGRLKNKEFINNLVNQLADDVPEVQEAVDDALIKIGEIHEIPLLAPYLDSFSKSERKTAFQYFGIHHPDKISDKFVDGLQDPSVEIRVISFKVIANQKLATLDLIRKGIADPVDTVQVQAVRTIRSLPKDESTLSLIKELLEASTSERLKVELIQVLSGLEEFNVVGSVIPLLEDESSWVRLETVEFLKQQGDSSVVKHLEQLLNSEDEELVEVVEEAIDYLE